MPRHIKTQRPRPRPKPKRNRVGTFAIVCATLATVLFFTTGTIVLAGIPSSDVPEPELEPLAYERMCTVLNAQMIEHPNGVLCVRVLFTNGDTQVLCNRDPEAH